MADKRQKHKKNQKGPYYVDTECIACDACVITAPEHFCLTEDEISAYVKKQPETEEEKAFCQEALESCPVEAIGNDGLDEKRP